MANSLLPARKGEQHQGALISCTENVHLWNTFLAKGDTNVCVCDRIFSGIDGTATDFYLVI
jgi:hypothetical protein